MKELFEREKEIARKVSEILIFKQATLYHVISFQRVISYVNIREILRSTFGEHCLICDFRRTLPNFVSVNSWVSCVTIAKAPRIFPNGSSTISAPS